MNTTLKFLILLVMLLTGAVNAVAADDGKPFEITKTNPRPRSID